MTHRISRRTSVFLLVAVAALLVTLFASVASASARPLNLDGQRTKVTVVPATLDVLLGAGIVPLPVAPSPVVGTKTSLRYTFPVTTGRVDSKTLAGRIRHSGGVLFVQRAGTGWNTLKLSKFTINIGTESYITAIVNGGKRLRVLELDLGNAAIKQYTRKGRTYVYISRVAVGLNDTAIGAVNATFGTALPTGDVIPFGTANVLARVARAH
jgi:hypothetical protein